MNYMPSSIQLWRTQLHDAVRHRCSHKFNFSQGYLLIDISLGCVPLQFFTVSFCTDFLILKLPDGMIFSLKNAHLRKKLRSSSADTVNVRRHIWVRKMRADPLGGESSPYNLYIFIHLLTTFHIFLSITPWLSYITYYSIIYPLDQLSVCRRTHCLHGTRRFASSRTSIFCLSNIQYVSYLRHRNVNNPSKFLKKI